LSLIFDGRWPTASKVEGCLSRTIQRAVDRFRYATGLTSGPYIDRVLSRVGTRQPWWSVSEAKIWSPGFEVRSLWGLIGERWGDARRIAYADSCTPSLLFGRTAQGFANEPRFWRPGYPRSLVSPKAVKTCAHAACHPRHRTLVSLGEEAKCIPEGTHHAHGHMQ
jgi:hypothetical protein